MRDEKIRKAIDNFGKDEEVAFKLIDGFDGSIIGISNDNRLIYDYKKMIEEFAKDNNCSYFDAEEFIQYNTLRALPYENDKDGMVPIVLVLDIDLLKESY